MNNSQDVTSLNLPQPSSQGSFNVSSVVPEQIAVQQQWSTVQPISVPTSLQSAMQPQIPAQSSAQNYKVSPDASDSEKDDDALDIEWVQKAKAIVEQTHADPYTESQALNRVKADYLKSRYGKDLKI